MSDELSSSDALVTVLAAKDSFELAMAQATLRESNVPFVTRNEEMQHLMGGSQVAGFEIPEILVKDSDADRARQLIQEVLDRTDTAEVDAATGPPVLDSADARATRFARYSAVFAVFGWWGVGSLLAIYFSVKALMTFQSPPPLSRYLAVFGLILGVVGLVAACFGWAAPFFPAGG